MHSFRKIDTSFIVDHQSGKFISIPSKLQGYQRYCLAMAVLGSASPNEVEVPANASVTSVSAVPESPLQITAKDDSTLCSQHDAEKGTDVGKAESIVSTQQASTSDLEHSNQTATNPPTEPECTYSTLSPSPGHVLRRHETMFSSKPQLLSAASWKPQTYQSWRSPILMIMLFLVGFAFSVGHCIFYPSLNGKIVGDSSQQEGKLRLVFRSSYAV